MSEKVLGFRKKDAYYKQNEPPVGHQVIEIEEIDLVPVVSLEALQKWCKENKYTDWEGKCSCGKEFSISSPDKINYFTIDDLLSWAEKEAKKK